MGYHTDYIIVASPVTEEVYEKIDKVLRTFNGYVESNGVDNGVGEWTDADDTWYDSRKHMIEVSRVFPEIHFVLYVRIQYAPDLNSRMKYGSKHFLARSNQVNRWIIDQCDYLLAYYYEGIPNRSTSYVRHGLRNPNVTVISVVDRNTVSQIEKRISEIEGRKRLVLDGIRNGRTYKSIGDEFHISSSRVMQITDRVFQKIMYAIHDE